MSGTETTNSAPIAFGNAIPVLRVGNLAASLDYYERVLGFQLNWQQGDLASVTRDRCNLFLCQGDQGHPGSWVWLDVRDVDALFAEYKGKDAKVWHPPTNYPWAYEMHIADLDGNVLRMAGEPKPGLPAGEWRDMRGDLWVVTRDGGWTRAR